MKKILKYTLLGLSVVATTSCIDTLDTHPTVTHDAETVWGNKKSVEGFVYDAYYRIIEVGYAGSGTCVQWESRTPNGIHATQAGTTWGTYDAVALEQIGNNYDLSPGRFTHLRKANMIIENVENSSALTEDEKQELKAHGHMLRGMIFFDQARKMGRFVPVKQVFNESDSLTCLIPLTKDIAESYELVMSDLKYAAENLPSTAPKGVPTKWAAKVILSRAALQAYAYTGDKSYIDIALNAAKEVVDNPQLSLSTSNGMFNDLDQYNSEILWGYYRESNNTYIGTYAELQCAYPNVKPEDLVNAAAGNPTPFKNTQVLTFECWAAFFPTQDLVDQFLAIDAKTNEALPWYETSQWLDNVETLDPTSIRDTAQVDRYTHAKGPRTMPSVQDLKDTNPDFPTFSRYAKLKEGAKKDISSLMYENRDKRFYTAVVYDGCDWAGEYVETRLGGNYSRGVRDAEDGGWYCTSTGYYWRKNNIENPNPRFINTANAALHFNLARVGEAYMNLAEAYLLKEDVPNAVAALNATRTVHGGIAESTAFTLEDAWKDYIRERNCEMCNEGGDIYFSYLRWGKYGGYANHGEAPGAVIKDLNKPVYQMQINRDRSAILVNQVTIVQSAKRVFTDRRYLLPIKQDWLNTRETYGIQDNYNQVW